MSTDNEPEDSGAETNPADQTDHAQAASDAEATPETERPDSVTITNRGRFNRRPPNRRN